jgi:hypothetical protein
MIFSHHIAHHILPALQCAAAHLNSGFLSDSIPQSDAYSWIRLGFDNANQKLFIGNTAASEGDYTYKPSDPSQAIGYEGSSLFSCCRVFTGFLHLIATRSYPTFRMLGCL